MRTVISEAIAILSIVIAYPVRAQQKVVLACDISNTVGLERKDRQWETFNFPPWQFYTGSRKHFFLALQNNIITEESAKDIFQSSGADCHGRDDVNSTYCNSPIGDNLYFDTAYKVGSISDIATISHGVPVTVSIFSCQRF